MPGGATGVGIGEAGFLLRPHRLMRHPLRGCDALNHQRGGHGTEAQGGLPPGASGTYFGGQ